MGVIATIGIGVDMQHTDTLRRRSRFALSKAGVDWCIRATVVSSQACSHREARPWHVRGKG